MDLLQGSQVGPFELPESGPLHVPDAAHPASYAKPMSVEFCMEGALVIVKNPLFQWLDFIRANGNLLRIKDGRGECEGDRYEKAMEFQ